MKTDTQELFQILTLLEQALAELEDNIAETNDRTLKVVYRVIMSAISMLRFYLATQGKAMLP